MCLVVDVKAKKKYTWFKTITVYKVLEYEPLSLTTKFRTPYRNFDVEFGECYTSELKKYIDDNIIVSKVNKGLHSICSLDEAKKLLHALGGEEYSYRIVECVIPPFSIYYEGKFRESNVILNSIASSKLIYLKIV